MLFFLVKKLILVIIFFVVLLKNWSYKSFVIITALYLLHTSFISGSKSATQFKNSSFSGQWLIFLFI